MASSRLALLLLLLGACATTRPIDLRTPAGAAFDLHEEARAHAAMVLVFWSSGCPCVTRYQDRVDALEAAWAQYDVAFVAVSSNVDDDLATLRAYGPPQRVVIDENGALADSLGARSTPTAVLLDGDGTVRFHGWIDNERFPGDPERQPWLEDALEDLRAGRQVTRPRTPTWGCAITRSLGEVTRCDIPAGG